MTDDLRARLDPWHMAHALGLAERGRGRVEPNPLVGCIVAHGAEIVGEGWHQRFGGPHAEVMALALAGSRAAGATVYVTLEPCCHVGKTPPCVEALRAAQVARVVAAQIDPFPQVSGGGLAALASAGIETTVGVLEAEAGRLNRPYFKLLGEGLPWVIAKWAMTLDGRMATRSGDSQWISNESSRRVVHELRGRVDAILVGSGTAQRDDPLLTARPAGLRRALRVVLDGRATLSSDSQLVRTAGDVPLLVAVGPEAAEPNRRRLERAGCEVLTLHAANRRERLHALLAELGRRRVTNLLVEGGPTLLGALVDARAVDEAHVFIAPRCFGGGRSAPLQGAGVESVASALSLAEVRHRLIEGDLYVSGIVVR